MTVLLVVVLLGVTVVALGAARPERSGSRSPAAILGRLLEFTGLWVLCFFADEVAGVIVILTLRAVSRAFVSVYVLNDVSVVILAAVQAFVVYSTLAADGA